jgi:LysR family transcriptional regulator, glycine cleavage system transcriptional activator
VSGRLPLNSLRAFEAVARKRSFSRAADELHVTHAAISHQVKALEQFLGAPLIRRGRSIDLTDAGRRLFPVLSESLDNISEAVNGIQVKRTASVVNVSLTGTFASKWLIPRLGRFLKLHPNLDVRLRPSYRYVDLTRENFDIAIRCGQGDWPELSTTYLLPVDLIPVCSPNYLKTRAPLEIADLSTCKLLHADIGHHRIGEEWGTWLSAAGINVEPDTGLSFHDASLALQAAMEGLGIAMGYEALISADVAAGRLTTPFRSKVRASLAYYIVSLSKTAAIPKIASFRSWLLDEARTEADLCVRAEL